MRRLAMLVVGVVVLLTACVESDEGAALSPVAADTTPSGIEKPDILEPEPEFDPMAIIFYVIRESIMEQNQDKVYWVTRLAALNAMSEGLNEYLAEVNEAARELQDSDRNGCLDLFEESDGVSNFLRDDNGNGIFDINEDSDGDGIPDPLEDDDGDTVVNMVDPCPQQQGPIENGGCPSSTTTSSSSTPTTTPTVTTSTTTASTSTASTTTSTTTTTTSTTTTSTTTTPPPPVDGEGPIINFFQANESDLWEDAFYGGCARRVHIADVGGVASDPSGILSVWIDWSVGTSSGTVIATEIADSVYFAEIGPFADTTLTGEDAAIYLQMTAYDIYSNETVASSSDLIVLHDCAVG